MDTINMMSEDMKSYIEFIDFLKNAMGSLSGLPKEKETHWLDWNYHAWPFDSKEELEKFKQYWSI